MSESLFIGILLSVSGGIMDAYSYIYRGEVFANAQTGNVLLFSIHLSNGEWVEALHYAFPIMAFLCGVALAAFICYFFKKRKSLHWRQLCVLYEAMILAVVSCFSQDVNLLANCCISFACGIQVEAFRKIENENVATTMCIGNLRSAMHSAITGRVMGSYKDRHTAYISFVMVLAFAVGAVMVSVLIQRFGAYSICCSSIILLLCFGGMFFSPSVER